MSMSTLEISSLLSYFAGLSIAAQKMTDMVKTYLPMERFSDKGRKTAVMAASFLSSGIASMVVPPEGVPQITSLPWYYLFCVTGILGSSGSGLWHDAQSILVSFKEQLQQQVVKK